MNMTIRKKLLGGFLLVILIILSPGITTLVTYKYFHAITDKIVGLLYVDSQKGMATLSLVQWTNNLGEQLFKDVPFKGEMDPKKCTFGQWLNNYKPDNPEITNIQAIIQRNHIKIHEAAEKALGLYKDQDKVGGQKVFKEEIEPVCNEIIKLGEDICDILDLEIEQSMARHEKLDRFIEQAIPIIYFIGIVLGLAIVLFLTRILTKPIQRGSIQITTAANQILAASQEQTTGIEEEVSQVSQTATSARQLVATAKSVTDLSNEIANSSRASAQMANSGSQSVNNVGMGMTKIRQSVLDTAKKIEALGERSQAITEIVDLIDDIANQTNLLSLNASIEAARAGEAGKGFAVVADAIGKLADRTTKSTKDISDLIKGIQQDTSSCVMSMEESTKETEKGAVLAEEAVKSLKEIVSAFEKVAQAAKEISLSSQQQASGSEQISKAMTGMDQIMKQSAVGAKQSMQSARELVVLANEFKKVIGIGKLGEKDEKRV